MGRQLQRFGQICRKLAEFLQGVMGPARKDLILLAEQNRFLLYEIKRLNEMLRYQMLGKDAEILTDRDQTVQSFQYQWEHFPDGCGQPSDSEFMKNIETFICQVVALPKSWFPGKKVVDLGCGAGRFSYGLLSLGATVAALDVNDQALERTRRLCQTWSERLITGKVDLLRDRGGGDCDLAFCYGVVHHTGNTYRAIFNAASYVKPGGRLFLMVYGFPQTLDDFRETNSYESMREKFRPLSFEERKRAVTEQYGPDRGHGWFDASSPRINDLLTFAELADFLGRLGLKNVRRTFQNRNHHVVADKP